MFIAKLLNKQAVSNAIERLSINSGKILETLEQAGAFQDSLEQFNADYILGNLDLDQQDGQDLIAYLGQNILAKRHGEVDQIDSSDWMQNESLKDKYLANAHILGFMSPEVTSGQYDEIWVLGTSQPFFAMTLNFLKKALDTEGVQANNIRLLTGKRELSISPEFESEKYIRELADKLGIEYNKDISFIKREDGRTYLNYLSTEKRRLYETDMVRDTYEKVFRVIPDEAMIIDADAPLGKARPDVEATVKLACKGLKARENLKLAIASFQPFISRQIIECTRLIKENCESLEFSCERIALALPRDLVKTKIEILHSEMMGPWLFESYLTASSKSLLRTREIDDIRYNTRKEEVQLSTTAKLLQSKQAAIQDLSTNL